MNDSEKTAKTPAEYLAGVRSGIASRDGEVHLLNAHIRELVARQQQIVAALFELLSGHDELYRAHWHYLPTCDPADDMAAKAARTILADIGGTKATTRPALS